MPLFLALQLFHWLTLLVDEVLFRGYRRVEIREPIFILGPPRSGTTHLHQVMARDPQRTTPRTWECLFGLSITERKLVGALTWVDQKIGRPAARLGSWIGRRWLSSMDDIHPLSLAEPEEEFLWLMPLAACFILIVAFPRADWLWRVARFDVALEERDIRDLLQWYRGCIRRHLYVAGPEMRFLSKNASFSGMADSLLREFPDARILYTMRAPDAVVPSQLSSLRPGLALCGFPQYSDAFRDRLLDLLAFYYRHLASVAAENRDRMAMIYNDDLRDNLESAVLDALAKTGLAATDEFRKELSDAATVSRGFKSGHSYTLDEFGLDSTTLASRFAGACAAYDFEMDVSDAAKLQMTTPTATAQVQSLDQYMDEFREAPGGAIGPVVIVSDSLPERNGVGAYYCDLLHLLEDEGYEATLLCPSEDRPTIFQFPLPGDSTQRIWIPSLFRFRDVMNAVKPRAIVAATPGPYGLLGAWWSRRLGAKFIVGFHTHFSGVTDLYNNRFLRTFSRFYFRIADNILFRYGDLVLANSEAMVELAERLGARRVGIMGTLLPRDSLPEPETYVEGDLKRVVFAGRLAPEKRVQTVFEAAQQLPHIQFTVAGDGPLKDEAVRYAQLLPNFEFVGWVSRKQLLEQMDRADVLVLNSVVESFGTVALEAMARGRLALVSKTCGIVEWPGLVESLYQIDDGESLSDAIARIAALTADERTTTAQNARRAALRLNRGSLLHWLDTLQCDED